MQRSNGARPVEGFRRSLALLIGIGKYSDGIPPLKNAAADADAVGRLLRDYHGFEVETMTDGAADRDSLRRRLASMRFQMASEDRLLLYFAGHGVATDGDDGPEGYLLLSDARAADPSTFMKMVDLHEALTKLPCRHVLIILDCCFAGAFRWSSGRSVSPVPPVLHKERYEWFIRDAAWQVFASAAHDQKAADVVAGEAIGERGESGEHSPFAAALLSGLTGAADATFAGRVQGDGVITLTELFVYVRDRLQPKAESLRPFQTPSLWPLWKHDKGEFVFLAPGASTDLPPAPPLLPDANPWRGLEPYEEKHEALFFGRARAAEDLTQKIGADTFTAVVGPSGSGKSSLLSAGALPRLRKAGGWVIAPPFRPGTDPFKSLADCIAAASNSPGSVEAAAQAISSAMQALVSENGHLLIVIDQFEELATVALGNSTLTDFCTFLTDAIASCNGKLTVCVTVRSDFESLFHSTSLRGAGLRNRFVVPPMTQDELRRCIELPASTRVMRFENDELVETLINEVLQTPGPLPMLSFVLSELYTRSAARADGDRLLRAADYAELEGVAGALQHRASQEYEAVEQERSTIKRVLLRMISLESGEIARRRVPRSELRFADVAENRRVESVLARLTQARLLVTDQVDGKPSIEPAHEALIRGWDKLAGWIRDVRADAPIARTFSHEALGWDNAGRPNWLLWHNDPRLSAVHRIVGPDGTQRDALLPNRTEDAFFEASRSERLRRRRNFAIILGVLAFVAMGAAYAVVFLSGQSSQRGTSATLLARATEITSKIEGPRQFDGLLAAIEAADLSRTAFGRITPGVRGIFMRALERVRETDRWSAAQAQTNDIVVTPDGTRILIRLRRDGDDEGKIPVIARSWTLEQPHEVIDIKADGAATETALCPTGACVVALFSDHVDVLAPDGRHLFRLTGRKESVALDYDPASHRLFSGGDDGRISVRDATGPTASILVGESIRHVRLSADRKHLLVLCERRTFVVDIDSHRKHEISLPATAKPETVAITPDGQGVLYTSGPGEIQMRRVGENAPEFVTRQGNQRVDRISLSLDGNTLAFTSATEGATFVVDMKLGAKFTGPLFGGANPAIALTPDGRTLVEVGYLDGMLKTFDLQTPTLPGKALQIVSASQISAVQLCDGGKTIVWGGDKGEVGTIEVYGGKGRTLMAHADYVGRILCLGEGRFATSARDGRVLLWQTDGKSTELGTGQISVADIASSVDRSAILAAGSHKVWRFGLDGSTRQVLETELDDINRIAVSSKTGAIALGSSGAGNIGLYAADGRQIVRPFRVHTGIVMSLALSPWDDTMVSGGTVGTTSLLPMSIWDFQGKQVQSVVAHPTIVSAVAFGPSNGLLVSGGSDGAVRLWDAELLKVGPDLARLGQFVVSVSVDMEGESVTAAASNGAVRIMFLGDDALVRHACARVFRHPRVRSESGGPAAAARRICDEVESRAASKP